MELIFKGKAVSLGISLILHLLPGVRAQNSTIDRSSKSLGGAVDFQGVFRGWVSQRISGLRLVLFSISSLGHQGRITYHGIRTVC